MFRLSDEIHRLEELKVLADSSGYNGRERMTSNEEGETSGVHAVVGPSTEGFYNMTTGEGMN